MSLWRNTSFVVWLLGAVQSRFGSALAAAATSFLVLEHVGQASDLSVTLALGFLPALLLPLVGVWTDRLPLKWPLVGGAVVSGAVQLGLAGLALHPGLFGWSSLPMPVLYAAALVGGLAGVVAQPAAQSAVPLLVPAADLSRANGLMASTRQAATLLGFLAGGTLTAWAGAPVALLLDGLTYLLAALLTALVVRFPPRPTTADAAERPKPLALATLLAESKVGLEALWSVPTLRHLPLLFLVLNAAGAPLQVLVPAELSRLSYGAAGYGGFLTAEMLGGLLAGACVALAGQRLPVRAAALGWLLLAVGLVALAATPASLPYYWAAASLIGFGQTLSNVPLMTLLGQSIAPQQLGRAFGVLGSVSMVGMPLSLLALGAVLDHLPAPISFSVLAAVLTVCAAVLVRVLDEADTSSSATAPATPLHTPRRGRVAGRRPARPRR